MIQSLGFIQNMRGWEWIVILVLALVLFGGAKKLPDAARGLGRSLRIFKSETKGLVGDGDEPHHKDDVDEKAGVDTPQPGREPELTGAADGRADSIRDTP